MSRRFAAAASGVDRAALCTRVSAASANLPGSLLAVSCAATWLARSDVPIAACTADRGRCGVRRLGLTVIPQPASVTRRPI